MTTFRRLTELQHRRNKKILFTVMHHLTDDFSELYKSYFHKAQIDAPFIVTSFFSSPETTLAHDSHPNDTGHAILSAHYIHALNKLGWVPVPEEVLPVLDERLSLEFSPRADEAYLRKIRKTFVDSNLKTSLDFSQLTRVDVRGFLGGLLPHKKGKGALRGLPWASIRSGFALKRPLDRDVKGIEVQIRIPPRVELFPFHIEMLVNGELMNQYDFHEPNASGNYTLTADVPPLADSAMAIEVLLRTDSYFTQIYDGTMRSYRLLRARVL